MITERSMNIIVTAGGTSEPIDNVRRIANTGTGRLGSLVADELAEADWTDHIFMSVQRTRSARYQSG